MKQYNGVVSDSDIGELFSEFGSMKTAVVHYNSTGKSLGTAHVIFTNRNDAVRAMKQYNGVHLDGRPMKIGMEGGVITGGARPKTKGSLVKRLSGGPKGAGKGARSRGGRGRKGKGGAKPKPKTAEELDAELDAYLNTKPQTADDLDKDLDSYKNGASKETTVVPEAEK